MTFIILAILFFIINMTNANILLLKYQLEKKINNSYNKLNPMEKNMASIINECKFNEISKYVEFNDIFTALDSSLQNSNISFCSELYKLIINKTSDKIFQDMLYNITLKNVTNMKIENNKSNITNQIFIFIIFLIQFIIFIFLFY